MDGGPPCFPPGFTCPAVLRILLADSTFRLHGSHVLRLLFPQYSAKSRQCLMQSSTPQGFLPTVWPLSLSLATTQEISVDFSSSPYLDVSVQAVSLTTLFIHAVMTEVFSVGLLHSDIHGSKRTYRSPWLFAVNHVLLRLPMPRHSPCALLRFTICFMLFF